MDRASARIPDFFIIGAPRCGTTFLHSALRAQPGVFMPEWKEPNYFAEDIDTGVPAGGPHRVRELAGYLDLFAAAHPADLLGEASANYLLSTVAVPRILDANPHARFIVSLRDPVEEIASFHGLHRALGVEQLDLQTALANEQARLTWANPTRLPMLQLAPRYLDTARYGEQLERLFAVAPRDQVLVLKLDDIRANQLAALTRVSRFLGLPGPVGLGPLQRNASRVPRSGALLKVVWTRRGITVAKKLVPRRLHAVAGRASHRMLVWNRMDSPVQAVPPQLRQQLETELRPDLELASRLLGEDLVSRWWGPSESRPSSAPC